MSRNSRVDQIGRGMVSSSAFEANASSKTSNFHRVANASGIGVDQS